MAIDALHDPLARLIHLNRTRWDEEVLSEMQEAVDQLARTVKHVRSLSGLLTSALDANLTQVSVRQNEDMRKISAWVAIAAVPTMVAGIYGMNFEHMPELGWRFGYPTALGPHRDRVPPALPEFPQERVAVADGLTGAGGVSRRAAASRRAPWRAPRRGGRR